MSDYTVANLKQALDSAGKDGLNGLVLFGKVRCAIESPEWINKDRGIWLPGGRSLAILDIIGVQCLGNKHFEKGKIGSSDLYITKGSVVIVIRDKSWIGKPVAVSGKGFEKEREGATLKKQFGTDAYCAFVFAPDGKNNYGRNIYSIQPNAIIGLHQSHGRMLEYMFQAGDIVYPFETDSIMAIEAISNYKEIDVDQVEGMISTGSLGTVEQQGNGSEKKFDTSSDRIDVSKIDMGLTYHLEGMPQHQEYDAFNGEIEKAKKNRNTYCEELKSSLDELVSSDMLSVWTKELCDGYIRNILCNPDGTVGKGKERNKNLIEELIEYATTGAPVASGNTKSKDDSSDEENSKNSMIVSIIQMTPEDLIDGKGHWIRKQNELACFVLSQATGISVDSLRTNFYTGKRNNKGEDELMSMLLFNPYLWGMYFKRSIAECDMLYLASAKRAAEFFGEGVGKGISGWCRELRKRMVALSIIESRTEDTGDSFIWVWDKGAWKKDPHKVNDYIFDPSKFYKGYGRYISGIESPIPANAATSNRLLAITGNRYTCLEKDLISDMQKDTIKGYFHDVVNWLDKTGVVSGLIREEKDGMYLTIESDLEKEIAIYDRLREKGMSETGVNSSWIDDAITEYEGEMGFKLEKLQKDAIQLCKYKAGVLSGCAGSGKTTVSEVMKNVLMKLPGYSLVYCAPTGKACRRMSEVVKAPVRTLHSYFGIGNTSDSYLFESQYNRNQKDDKRIFIFDEMAMCSNDLLYSVVRKLSTEDIVFFLGDVKQLPPIGRGCPFRSLMRLLPCVELGVSKRAAEGSLVNYNTSLVNFVSTPTMKELLYDDKTFIARSCQDEAIPKAVSSVWKEFMSSGIDEKDIQVITGYRAAGEGSRKYSECSVLNPILQEMLRAGRDPQLFQTRYGNIYYKEDRLIHLENNYDIRRYVYAGSKGDKHYFREVVTSGIVNGEIEYLKGIYPASSVVVEEFEDDFLELRVGKGEEYHDIDKEFLRGLLEARELREDKLRDDDTFFKKCAESGDKKHFVAVGEVYDTDLKTTVYVFYRMSKKSGLDGYDYMAGMDLSKFDLAYALTTHKMQGSQSKAVILPFSSKSSPKFINRNMINTMITRSQGIVACIGSILGPDSVLNQGRKEVSRTDQKDILAYLTGSKF